MCIWIIVLICFDLYILGFSAIFLCFCWSKTWSCFPLYIIDTSGFLFFDFVIACKYQYSCFHIRDVAFDFHCTQALMHGRNFFVLMVESLWNTSASSHRKYIEGFNLWDVLCSRENFRFCERLRAITFVISLFSFLFF